MPRSTASMNATAARMRAGRRPYVPQSVSPMTLPSRAKGRLYPLGRTCSTSAVDFEESPEEQAFRAEARAFLEGAAGTEIAEAVRFGSPSLDNQWVDRVKPWQAHLAEHRWAGIAWPTDSGGRGGTATAAVHLHRGGLAPRAGRRTRSRSASPWRGRRSSPTAPRSSVAASSRRCCGATRCGASSSASPGAGSDLAGLSTRGRP